MNAYSNEKRRSRDLETAAFQYATALVFLWLMAGFWQLQVQDPEVYEARAARNSVKALPILAPRGKILDREGRVMVDNAPSFRVMLPRDGIKQANLPLISEGLSIPYERLRSRLYDLADSRGPEYQNVIVKEDLSLSEVAFVEAHRDDLPQLELVRSHRRLYPRDGFGAHVLGYVGEISSEELDKEEFVLYDQGAEVGKAGVEREYNDALTGVDGSRLVMVDSRSRRVRDLDVVEAKPGHTLQLTIDLDLQAVAELAMDNRRGAVVALDPRNGEILAMVSRPAYDLNRFVGGIDSQDWQSIINDPFKPMLNRAVQAQLAPGSIFKPFMALAGLETGVIDPEFKVHCSGGATFYGRYFRCHKAAGHGWVNLQEAIKQSCDVYFYTVGKELGIDRIAKYAEMAGFGGLTGIDLPGEAEGVVPSSRWKVRFFRDKWYAGETISVSIGQGALTVTPVQAAYAIGGLAMGGVWQRPHLLSDADRAKIRPHDPLPASRRLDISENWHRAIVDGMWGVVNDGGTGGRAAIPDYDVCGKTGSAQRVSRAFAQGNQDERYKDDGWFISFAPCKAPEIAVAVLYENGQHGAWAAPIARDVMKAYFDKQKRQLWSQRRKSIPATEPAALAAAPAEPKP